MSIMCMFDRTVACWYLEACYRFRVSRLCFCHTYSMSHLEHTVRRDEDFKNAEKRPHRKVPKLMVKRTFVPPEVLSRYGQHNHIQIVRPLFYSNPSRLTHPPPRPHIDRDAYKPYETSAT